MSKPKTEITDDVAEHLARLLEHADQLLGEWKKYSDSLRDNLDQRAVEAGERAAQAMQKSLDGLSGHAARGRVGVSARRPWLWAVAANLIIGAVLAILIVQQDRDPQVSAATGPVDAAAIVVAPDAAVVDAAVAIDAALPPPLCAGLLRGAQPSTLELIRACAVVACGFQSPKKDPRNRALRKALEGCKPESEAANVAALGALLRDGKALTRCQVEREADGSFAVDERFFATCRGGNKSQ